MTTVGTSYNIAPNAPQTAQAPVSARTLAAIFNLGGTLPNTAVNGGADLYNLSVPNLCPVVGYAYQITLSVQYSIQLAGTPAAGFPNVGLSLSYGPDSGANAIVKTGAYAYVPLNNGFITSTMVLTFNHTSTANKLIISNINNTSQIITGTGSLLQIQSLGVVSLGPITGTIPTSVFTLG